MKRTLSAGEALDYLMQSYNHKLINRHGGEIDMDTYDCVDGLTGGAPFTLPEQKRELTWSEIEKALNFDGAYCAPLNEIKKQLGFEEE